MRTSWFAVLAAIGILGLMGTQASATNLVLNGDFSLGNVDFTSAYTYQSDDTPEGTYYVGTNPSLHNCCGWGDFPDPNGSFSAPFMMLNGASVPNVDVWSETVAVLPNTTYYFSAYVASNYPVSPANLDFSINGSQVGSDLNASSTVGQWLQFYVSWNSGANTSADLSIVNQNTAAFGNDFSLDLISLDQGPPSGGTNLNPVPEPSSLALLGSGIVGMIGAAKSKFRR